MEPQLVPVAIIRFPSERITQRWKTPPDECKHQSDPETKTFRGCGVRITADLSGPMQGTPVILLHGGGQTRTAWGKAMDEGARRGYRMISPDLRGHGESEWAADGDYSLAAGVGDLSCIISQFDRSPFIVGASLGGLIGLAYAGLGRRLRGLILVDVAPNIESQGAERIQKFMRSAPDGFASVEEAADAVASFLPHRTKPSNANGLKRNLRLGPDGRYRWHWDPRILNGRDVQEARSLRESARSIRIPILLVRGRLSEVLSSAGVHDFLRLAPHAEFIDIENADHMVAGDQNDAFNEAIFGFLDRQAPRSAA